MQIILNFRKNKKTPVVGCEIRRGFINYAQNNK